MAVVAKPFQPFAIRPADGQRIPVASSEFIWMPKGASRTFAVYQEPEAYQIVDLLLVTALDFDGHSKKKRPKGANGA